MIDEDEKNNKIARLNQYPELPIKPSDFKKEERIQRVANQVVQLKKDPTKQAQLVKNPSFKDPKRSTPSVPEKKPSYSNDAVNKSKPPMMLNRPPIPPSAQQNKDKDKVTKVKN